LCNFAVCDSESGNSAKTLHQGGDGLQINRFSLGIEVG